MKKDDRSSLNPFTGQEHFDIIDDDKFLKQSSEAYYSILSKYELLDDTPNGLIVRNVAIKLIAAVEDYLRKINRFDYIENYYDWDFHLVNDKTVNAFCMPGGKILMFAGILSIANTEEKLAFILGHEMAHALLDHSRTQASVESAKNTAATVGWFGSFALDLIGLGEVGNLTRAAINVADMGSDLLLVKPFGRGHELEADKLGMMIIHWAGYDIHDIPAFWEAMSGENANNFDFFSTHPSDDKRIATMKELIIEIENQKDFYSKPVLGTSDTTQNPQLETPKSNPKSVSTNINGPNKKPRYYNDVIPKHSDSIKVNKPKIHNRDVIPKQHNTQRVKRSYVKKHCPNCDAVVGENDIFCMNCGYRLAKRFCSNCGTPITDDLDVFCFNCGKKL